MHHMSATPVNPVAPESVAHATKPPDVTPTSPPPPSPQVQEEPLHLPDDRFIPVRAEDLGAAMARDFETFGPEAPLLAIIEREMEEVIEQEASACERALSKLYVPFNPDRDTIPFNDAPASDPWHRALQLSPRGSPASAVPPGKEGDYALVNRWMAYLLDKANFERLDEVNLEAVIRQAGNSSIKIRVRPERIEHLDLWVRGKSTAVKRARTWKAPIKGVQREVGVYRRLAVIGRLRNDHTVFVKVFREIPFTDIEALLPHAEIRMSMIDRVKVWGGGAGAVGGGAAKLLQISLAMSITKLAWLLIVPLGGLAIKSFLGYRTAKVHRESQRTRNLYYQNLASNAAAIHMLVALIAQEEIKEGLIAYAICMSRVRRGLCVDDESAINAECCAYLLKRFGVAVDFDIVDAMETLDRLGLRVGPPGSRRLLPPGEAAALLTEHWHCRRSEGYHAAMVGTRCEAKSLKGTRWG